MRRSVHQLLEQADIKVDGDRPWDIRVKDSRFWHRVLLQGNIGLGDAYVDGWWECRAIDEFISRVLKVASRSERQPWRVVMAGILQGVLCNLQSLRRAFQVGEHHYDIGNELYREMLGEDMVYSCGYWQGGARTLEQAQHAKLELVCRKLGLEKGMRVLDIGCGWGSFCKYAAENYSVKVVGLTVSKKQAGFAREHLKTLPVEIRLEDYRRHTGDYDRVVSIGMFEHVGPKNYRTYMDMVRGALKPDGLFLLHTIGANVTGLPVRTWITRNIFPNGYIPSIAQIGKAVEGRFVAEDLHNFGPDYSLTLMQWHANFERAWPELKQTHPQYTGRFHRMWRYYLLSCAGAFRARDLQLWQWVLSPEGTVGGYMRPA